MGTNYYHVQNAKPECECCKRPFETEKVHIGKSSVGWVFALHVIPEKGIVSLADWALLWLDRDSYIEDEYHARLTPQEMLSRIVGRGAGLQRTPIDGKHCIGHGAGTYDLIVSEFS